MAATKRKQAARKTATKKTATRKVTAKKSLSIKQRIAKPFVRLRQRLKDFLSRRPHRSFRRTRRRDYNRSLKLPGYWAFTTRVLSVIKANRKQLLLLGLLYMVFTGIFLGISSQEGFTTLRETLNEAGEYLTDGNWSALGEASLLALSTVTGAISPELSEAQQAYAVIFGLLMWLALVWLLRQCLAGSKVRIRDALYNSGAPIVPTALLFFVLLLQLLPVALAAIAYLPAQTSGLLDGGVEAMLFWIAAGGLAALSAYWITSTALAMVVVTLPGMYPLRALRIAGDMVVGRRLRILYRLLWMTVITVLAWVILLIPFIMIDMGLKAWIPAIDWQPIVPVVVLILGTISFIWMTTYVYLLYRGIVDDDAKPA